MRSKAKPRLVELAALISEKWRRGSEPRGALARRRRTSVSRASQFRPRQVAPLVPAARLPACSCHQDHPHLSNATHKCCPDQPRPPHQVSSRRLAELSACAQGHRSARLARCSTGASTTERRHLAAPHCNSQLVPARGSECNVGPLTLRHTYRAPFSSSVKCSVASPRRPRAQRGIQPRWSTTLQGKSASHACLPCSGSGETEKLGLHCGEAQRVRPIRAPAGGLLAALLPQSSPHFNYCPPKLARPRPRLRLD